MSARGGHGGRKPTYRPALLSSISTNWPQTSEARSAQVLEILQDTISLDSSAAPLVSLAAATAEDFEGDSDETRKRLRVNYDEVCSLFTVGINSVARALENKELHLAIMCIPSHGSYPLLAHLIPLAALSGTGLIAVSCASPALGACFGLRTAVAVGIRSSALNHPALARLCARLAAAAPPHRPQSLFGPRPGIDVARAAAAVAGAGLVAPLALTAAAAAAAGVATAAAPAAPAAPTAAVAAAAATPGTDTGAGAGTCEALGVPASAVAAVGAGANNKNTTGGGYGGHKGGKHGNHGKPAAAATPASDAGTGPAPTRGTPAAAAAALRQFTTNFGDFLGTAVYQGPALRITPFRDTRVKATVSIAAAAAAAAGKKRQGKRPATSDARIGEAMTDGDNADKTVTDSADSDADSNVEKARKKFRLAGDTPYARPENAHGLPLTKKEKARVRIAAAAPAPAAPAIAAPAAAAKAPAGTTLDKKGVAGVLSMRAAVSVAAPAAGAAAQAALEAQKQKQRLLKQQQQLKQQAGKNAKAQ